MGRLGVLAMCLAGCGFSGTSGGGGGGGDDPDGRGPDARRIDAPPGTLDAPIDAEGKPDADPCAAPFTRSPHGCHAFGAVSRADWGNARQACQTLGGDLPIINTSGESDHVATAIPAGSDDRVWLGLNGNGSDGSSWIWIDGESVATKGLDLWEFGEPETGDRCGVVRPDSEWAGRGCTSTFIVVCERFL